MRVLCLPRFDAMWRSVQLFVVQLANNSGLRIRDADDLINAQKPEAFYCLLWCCAAVVCVCVCVQAQANTQSNQPFNFLLDNFFITFAHSYFRLRKWKCLKLKRCQCHSLLRRRRRCRYSPQIPMPIWPVDPDKWQDRKWPKLAATLLRPMSRLPARKMHNRWNRSRALWMAEIEMKQWKN